MAFASFNRVISTRRFDGEKFRPQKIISTGVLSCLCFCEILDYYGFLWYRDDTL